MIPTNQHHICLKFVTILTITILTLTPNRDRLVLLIRDLKAEAARVVGAWVEDKGLLVALHYRYSCITIWHCTDLMSCEMISLQRDIPGLVKSCLSLPPISQKIGVR